MFVCLSVVVGFFCCSTKCLIKVLITNKSAKLLFFLFVFFEKKKTLDVYIYAYIIQLIQFASITPNLLGLIPIYCHNFHRKSPTGYILSGKEHHRRSVAHTHSTWAARTPSEIYEGEEIKGREIKYSSLSSLGKFCHPLLHRTPNLLMFFVIHSYKLIVWCSG